MRGLLRYTAPMNLDLLYEIHRELPRQAPGGDALTRRALAVCSLPSEPNVLDLGCGPGAQTITLANALPAAKISAVDLLAPFLDELRARAESAGVSERITKLNADIDAPNFTSASFDLVWAEGAAYTIGTPNTLALARRLLKPGGWFAFSELVWRDTPRPRAAVDFWATEYPDMTDIAGVEQQIAEADFRLSDRFELPDNAWWDDYYTPLAARLPALRERFADNADALAIINDTHAEIELRRAHSDAYAYAFFVCRVPERA